MNVSASCTELIPNVKRKTLLENWLGWVAVALIFFVPISTSLTSIFSILYVLLLLISGKYKEVFRFFRSPITLSLLYFVLINIIGIFYTSAPASDIYIALKKSIRLLLFPLLLPVFKDRVWQNRGLWALINAILLLVLLGYYNYINSGAELTMKDRIYASSFIAFEIFLLTLIIIEKQLTKWKKLVLASVIVVCFSYLMFINSGRTGQIIFLILFTMIIYKNLKKNILHGLIIMLLLGVAIGPIVYLPVVKLVQRNNESVKLVKEKIASPPIYHRFKETYNKSKDYVLNWYRCKDGSPLGEDSSIRLEFYARTLKLCFKKPIAGYGTGSFTTIYNAKYPERIKEGVVVSNPHNQYLLTFFEHGISGVIALLLIFYFLGKQTFRLRERFEAISLVGILFFMVVGCMVNSWLLDFTSSYFFICITGLICANSIHTQVSLNLKKSSNKLGAVEGRVQQKIIQ